MIANDEQLEMVRGQLGRLEEGLHSLAKTMRPQSETQFRVMAEGWVDQMAVLRAEVDDYLGVSAVKAPQPEIEIAIEGPHAALGDTRVSAVTKLMDRLRRALRTTVESARETLAPTDNENITEEFVEKLCDPPLQAVLAGSVRIQLASPAVEVGRQLYDQGLALLALGIRSASGEVIATHELQGRSPEQRKAALTAASLLSPDRADAVEQVGFGGRFLGSAPPVRFDRSTKGKIQQRLRRLSQNSSRMTVRGIIREIDLDRRLFTLRMAGETSGGHRCKYSSSLDDRMVGLVDHEVEVVGVMRSNASRASRLRVRDVQPIEEAS